MGKAEVPLLQVNHKGTREQGEAAVSVKERRRPL